MRVTTYDVRKGRDTLPALVKEKSCNYPSLESAKCPNDIWWLMSDVFHLGEALEEHTYALAYDNKMHLLGVFMLSKGTQEYALFGIKEAVSRLLMIRASSAVIVHNHPSGDPVPSKQDIDVTNKLKAACDLMDIKLFDHVIVSETTYCSMREGSYCNFS